MRLHHDEVRIDTDLVRRLLRAQAPRLAGLALEAAPAQGTDNLMFRLGPPVEEGRRAGPIRAYTPGFARALAAVVGLVADGRIEPGLVDPERAERVWCSALDAPQRRQPNVWVHRDLYGGNLLAQDGRLTGVIDFGGLAVGDPAGDVMAAFHVVSPADHGLFQDLLEVDDSTWCRARAWVLVQGLEALPYYLDTHPGMVIMARHAIRSTLADFAARR